MLCTRCCNKFLIAQIDATTHNMTKWNAVTVMGNLSNSAATYIEEFIEGFLSNQCVFMPPTLKKLEGHIAFGLSVCLCVCLSVCVCVCVNF